MSDESITNTSLRLQQAIAESLEVGARTHSRVEILELLNRYVTDKSKCLPRRQIWVYTDPAAFCYSVHLFAATYCQRAVTVSSLIFKKVKWLSLTADSLTTREVISPQVINEFLEISGGLIKPKRGLMSMLLPQIDIPQEEILWK